MSNAQQFVSDCIAERGYTTKHPTAHITKTVLKMLEEVCELATLLQFGSELGCSIDRLGELARAEFDRLCQPENAEFDPVIIGSTRALIGKELADVQVTVFDSATAVTRLAGVPYDVIAEAVEKADKDRKRGKRNGNH